ncbi:MAG: creatininase family protein [Bryobacteraceae bacterium]|nr:creatininase family protein [Bryobacteraceae bacterium]
MNGDKLKYRYDHHTWPEMKEVIARQPVCVLPIGSVEDHGHHLPLDVDNFLITSICEEAARRIPDETLLLPPIPYGFEDHHMSFPGTVTVKAEHLEAFVLDITLSLAHHGFRKILIADGHGSNMPILDLAARKTIIQSDALCACFIWPSLISDLVKQTREGPAPGGMSHACELETSVYLHLNAAAVQMDKARKEIGFHKSNYYWHDLIAGPKVRMMEWWSRISKTGVIGDPTVATAEKGKLWFDASVQALIEFIREFRGFEIREKLDLH